MKAVIMAGGYAKRLWPLTKETAKPLLPIAGKPMIDYIWNSMKHLSSPAFSGLSAGCLWVGRKCVF